ncbi:hypothetical protein CYMTET_14767 [Cymbomonas tetramitiformis]|uniref:Uncharacterized protein n=1 Tax=Cymbomonas tetramitiformis TaxID=36881 RepID=A0AAE0GFM9_9CHLO|nr:hypothetical protein CYMTET_14767 [Cymbomonas tetramitiformis]
MERNESNVSVSSTSVIKQEYDGSAPPNNRDLSEPEPSKRGHPSENDCQPPAKRLQSDTARSETTGEYSCLTEPSTFEGRHAESCISEEAVAEPSKKTGEQEGGKKEKAVKVKKILLRILRRIMEIPPDSPLMRVWRELRYAKKSGKQIAAGWYGIEVMDVDEVDNILSELIPQVDLQLFGNQEPRYTLSGILHLKVEVVQSYIELKNGRYRLDEKDLSPEAKQKIAELRTRAKVLHTQKLRAQSQRPSPMQDPAGASSLPDTPSSLVSPGQPGSLEHGYLPPEHDPRRADGVAAHIAEASSARGFPPPPRLDARGSGSLFPTSSQPFSQLPMHLPPQSPHPLQHPGRGIPPSGHAATAYSHEGLHTASAIGLSNGYKPSTNPPLPAHHQIGRESYNTMPANPHPALHDLPPSSQHGHMPRGAQSQFPPGPGEVPQEVLHNIARAASEIAHAAARNRYASPTPEGHLGHPPSAATAHLSSGLRTTHSHQQPPPPGQYQQQPARAQSTYHSASLYPTSSAKQPNAKPAMPEVEPLPLDRATSLDGTDSYLDPGSLDQLPSELERLSSLDYAASLDDAFPSLERAPSLSRPPSQLGQAMAMANQARPLGQPPLPHGQPLPQAWMPLPGNQGEERRRMETGGAAEAEPRGRDLLPSGQGGQYDFTSCVQCGASGTCACGDTEGGVVEHDAARTEERRGDMVNLLEDTFKYVWQVSGVLENDSLESIIGHLSSVVQVALTDIQKKST